MPRLVNTVPSYRRHKASGQAVVTLNGRAFYLGPYGTKASKIEYDRLVGEWQANGRQLLGSNGPTTDLSVNELLVGYWRFAQSYYHKDGKPTSHLDGIKAAIRFLKQLYGRHPAREFGPMALKTIRQKMIEAGHCRNYINSNIGRIKRVFKWGVENELVPPSVYHGLQAVGGLKRGRSDARESEPVKPVPEAFVESVLPHVSPQVAAMIRLQSLTGMRPGEVTILRGCDLDTTGKLWSYTPASHKTEHHGHTRVIYFGPRAQEVLSPWLKTDLQAYLFSPKEAEAARNAERREERQSPMTPSQANRRPKRNAKRLKRDHYDVASYRRAIARACDLAGVSHWHAHQLRHNAATLLRKEFGIEAARVVLGHRSAAVTEVYAEIDHLKAADIMLQVG
ncbi:MAG: tyrosine-type recombinase/integrase [Planctomycetes bacterium]|nr:tyrosine-type recombinase/integrase [Planctomycetota bacterium]